MFKQLGDRSLVTPKCYNELKEFIDDINKEAGNCLVHIDLAEGYYIDKDGITYLKIWFYGDVEPGKDYDVVYRGYIVPAELEPRQRFYESVALAIASGLIHLACEYKSQGKLYIDN